MREPMLGDHVREIVTGHEGVVTGVAEYLWGCRQHLVHYRDQDGKPQTEWYDVGRLEIRPELLPLEPVRHGGPSETAHTRGAEKPPPAVG